MKTYASGNFDIVMVSYLMINSKRDTSSLNVANHKMESLNADIKAYKVSSIKVFMSVYKAIEDEEHA